MWAYNSKKDKGRACPRSSSGSKCPSKRKATPQVQGRRADLRALQGTEKPTPSQLIVTTQPSLFVTVNIGPRNFSQT